jgi:hypothetical protein
MKKKQNYTICQVNKWPLFKWKNMYICRDAAVSSSSSSEEQSFAQNRHVKIRSFATIRDYIKLETLFIDTTYWSKEQVKIYRDWWQ